MRYELCASQEIPEGQSKAMKAGETKLVVYHLSDGFYATQARCPHVFASLGKGKILKDKCVQCPLHRAEFDIRTGEVVKWANFRRGADAECGAWRKTPGYLARVRRKRPALRGDLMALSKEEQQRAALARLEKFSRFTDNSIGIPFTRFRFGAEALIGVIPGIGDAAGLALASYVLLEAQRAGASKAVKLRMLRNMLIDFLGGLLQSGMPMQSIRPTPETPSCCETIWKTTGSRAAPSPSLVDPHLVIRTVCDSDRRVDVDLLTRFSLLTIH